MKSILLTLCLILAISCGSPEKKGVEIIDLEKAFNNRKDIAISDIASEWKYIKLETGDSCLTGPGSKIYATTENLVAIDRNQILLFERSTGKFIRKIGTRGNGPEAFSRTYSIMPVNDDKESVYAGRNKFRYEYSFDGKLINSISIPEMTSEIADINENIHSAFIPNYMGDEKRKIVLFDNNDSIKKVYPNYLSSPATNSISVFIPHSWFYKVDSKVYFYELFNDTLFSLTENALTPEYIINLGAYAPPYAANTGAAGDLSEYFLIRHLDGSSKYVFISFNVGKENYSAVYDKNKREVIVNNFSSESGSGFINNPDDLVPFEPSYINSNNELVCTIDAFRMISWIKENPAKAASLPGELKSMTETDNPVVVIAKLK